MNDEDINLILEACNLKSGTLYTFGMLGLLTGREFVEAFLNTLDDVGFTVVTKGRET